MGGYQQSTSRKYTISGAVGIHFVLRGHSIALLLVIEDAMRF